MSTRNIMSGRMPRRWGVLSGMDIGADGDPYLDRLRLIETPLFAVFLHHIHRPDRDPHPHDHPWAFWSWVLCGGYLERVFPDKHDPSRWVYRARTRGRPRFLNRKAAHMITASTGPLWTLVVTGRSYGSESWGFWVPVSESLSRGIQWRVYISANGAAEYAAAKDREDGSPQAQDGLWPWDTSEEIR